LLRCNCYQRPRPTTHTAGGESRLFSEFRHGRTSARLAQNVSVLYRTLLTTPIADDARRHPACAGVPEPRIARLDRSPKAQAEVSLP
jgi:hypothetical protein